MANLTPAQIYQYAYRAGFRGGDLVTAVAVALRESGGNTQAYNPESAAGTRPGSGSRGLWQIYGTAHPEFNNDLVYDPQANANAAYKVYREAGGRFTPWSTFNNGSASQLVPSLMGLLRGQAVKVTQGVSNSVTRVSSGVTTAVNNTVAAPTQAFESAGLFFQKITDANVIENGLAVGSGLMLIFIGLAALFLMSDTGKATVEAGVNAAKTAAIVA